MTTRITSFAASTAGAALLGLVGASLFGPIAARAAQSRVPYATPSAFAALRLDVDKPIAHLGETVLLTGSRFTPGALVAIHLHGPYVATLGPAYRRVRVGPGGNFAVPVPMMGYPDGQARLWRTIDVAAVSSARSNGVQEGAAVQVQVDPMPGLDVTTRAALKSVSWTIDGTGVTAWVTAPSPTRYHLGYAGHLRAGLHSAYVKWVDTSGAYGARAWTFRIGSPYAVPVAPRLGVSKARIRLGESLVLSGQDWTPGALVAISLGGPNTPPSGYGVGRVVVGGDRDFTLRVRLNRYPDANAQRAGMVYVNASATGSVVGDLPEGAAIPLQIAR